MLSNVNIVLVMIFITLTTSAQGLKRTTAESLPLETIDVELVTLSACNTGFGNDSTGREVDSLATFIELRGAKSVLATLWPVADESTSLLMSEFYKLKKENPEMTKAAAMQAAQNAMIEGKLVPRIEGGKRSAGFGGATSGTPPFPFDKEKPFAHPYYWSPFVLIGNWK